MQKSRMVAKIEAELAMAVGTVDAPAALLVSTVGEALDIVYQFISTGMHSGHTPVVVAQTHGFPNSGSVALQVTRKIFDEDRITDEASNSDVICIQVVEDSSSSGSMTIGHPGFPGFAYRVSRRNIYCAIVIDMTTTLGGWSPFKALKATGGIPALPLYPPIIGIADLRPFVLDNQCDGAVIFGHPRHVEGMEAFQNTAPIVPMNHIYRNGFDIPAVKKDMDLRSRDAQVFASTLRQIPGARVGYPTQGRNVVHYGSVVWVTLPATTNERELGKVLSGLQAHGCFVSNDFAGPDMLVRLYTDIDKRPDMNRRPGIRISMGRRNTKDQFAELVQIVKRFAIPAVTANST